MWYLNYLVKVPEASRENFELKTNLTSSCFQDAGKSLSPTSSTLAKLASAQKGMRSEHVTQSNGGVVQKSSIRKLPNLSTDGSIL